ncbi:MAG: poly-gamma-glutamate system protein [Bacilli bacterium]|nr:poly-gamma-glutamate system protein [Bacilli bacterium]
MKKTPFYIEVLYIVWALTLIVANGITFSITTTDFCRYVEEKQEASNLSELAMKKIKERKAELGIPMATKDILQTGLLGERYTSISTTFGVLEAKRTSLNPNFAAVIIDMFKEGGIEKGDEVGVVFSGSFPAINISVLSAIEIFELKPCIMISIGASSYGANHPEFTFLEIFDYLYQEQVFSNPINYISLGGNNDLGDEFEEDSREKIIQRIKQYPATFIFESDFETNIKKRMAYFDQDVPDMKMFINVGGNLVSMGREEAAFIEKNGLIKPSYFSNQFGKNSGNQGLLDRYLNKRIPIIHMLNIKGLAYEYNLPYDPIVPFEVGMGDVYMEKKYNITIPIVTLGLSGFLLVFLYFYKRNEQ